MIRIAPSMLSCDFSRMGEEAQRMEAAGADCLHLDVMDGMFVPNISFGIPVIASLRPTTDLPFDVHLMVHEPERYIERFIDAGADWVTVHVEACADLTVALDTIRLKGKRVGLSLNPHTPLEKILPYLDKCDYILVMTVEPGYGGQALIPSVLEKIKELRRVINERGLSLEIEVDGGVKMDNAKTVIEAGADILVAGSAVFGAKDVRATIEALRNPS